MLHPACLPPRSHQNLGLPMAEKLHLENARVRVRPEQIPVFVSNMRRNLVRVEEALRYRLQRSTLTPSGVTNHPLLSKFECVRVGQILADVVLDIAAISIARGSETYDAVLNTNAELSFLAPRVEVTSLPSRDPKHSMQQVPHGGSEEGPAKSSDVVPCEVAEKNIRNPSLLGSTAQFSAPELKERPAEGISSDMERHAEGVTVEPHSQQRLQQPWQQQQQQQQQLLLLHGGGGSDGSSDLSAAHFGRSVVSPYGFQGNTRNVSPVAERLHRVVQQAQSHNTISSLESHGNSSNGRRMRIQEFPPDVVAYQHPFSYSESPLSPTSVRFKPVLSMHSMADSSTVYLQPPRRPRKYYDIDFQKLSDFTHCLRAVERMFFTESDFEKVGLRYAIPGIRELDPKEVRSRKDCMDERCNFEANCFNRPEDDDVVKNAPSAMMTRCGTEVELHSSRFLQREGNIASSSFPPPPPPPPPPLQQQRAAAATDLQLLENDVASATQTSLCRSPTPHALPGQVTPTSDIRVSMPSLPSCKDQCLPLFRGGKDIIVQKKDLQIFIAMVEARLKQVDQEVDGRLHIAGVDLASSSGEDDALYTS